MPKQDSLYALHFEICVGTHILQVNDTNCIVQRSWYPGECRFFKLQFHRRISRIKFKTSIIEDLFIIRSTKFLDSSSNIISLRPLHHTLCIGMIRAWNSPSKTEETEFVFRCDDMHWLSIYTRSLFHDLKSHFFILYEIFW